ncbi:HAD family hydrolase [Geothrix sp. PMB-07]|uniref:HAD family hydrolase n=1 Tax=Geothrix sp. PMB-07 TaxID=3068640 RepID=UPI0027424CDC|nr:HAD family hydrolase [Geothrix sp. PMB-07]WLT30948.1 HAD family hydrolase [Geothrix sp. PMB-07]
MSPLGPIDAVMFDHDGTLVDSIPAVISASNGVLWERGLDKATPDQIVAGMVHPTAKRLGLLTGIDSPAAQENMAHRYSQLALHHSDLADLYPGVRQAVEALANRGLLLGVVSNSRGAFIRAILHRLGVADCFTAMIGEDDMPAPKPDPRGLLAALGAIPPGRAIYVGDSSADLQTARNAGVRAIGVTWGTHSRSELEPLGFDALVDSPQALADLIPDRPSLHLPEPLP